MFGESRIVRLYKVSYLCIVNLNILIKVQGKKQLSSKPKLVKVVSKSQELLQKYQLAAKEAHESLADEIKDKLVKVEAKSKSKTEQIASLVRMIFTQKRERILTLQLNFEICNTVLSGYTG